MRTNCIYSFVQKQTTYSITRALSDPRFKTYIQAAGGSEKQALLLYLWNIEMAGAVAATTGMVEVQLRNSINSRLQTWNASQPVNDPNRTCAYTRDWLKDPAPRLRQIISPPRKRPLWQKAEPALRDELGNCAKPNPSHDDLVAALPFGSWLSSCLNPRFLLLKIPGCGFGTRLSSMHLLLGTLPNSRALIPLSFTSGQMQYGTHEIVQAI